MRIETYNLTARNGNHIREATKITFDNGKEVRFTEKLTKKQCLKMEPIYDYKD